MNESVKTDLLVFKRMAGTLIGSIIVIKETLGNHSGTIASVCTFRQFTATKGDNVGKLYGVIECMVNLDSGNSIKCQVTDENNDFEIGDVVSVEIVESGKYQNAIIKGLGKKVAELVKAEKVKA